MAVRRAHELHPVTNHPGTQESPLSAAVPGSGAADRSITARGVLAEVDELFSRGEFENALTVADSILRIDPDSHEAASYAESCRLRLRLSYCTRLGSMMRIVTLAVSREDVRQLRLDHRAGFLLSCVDGFSTVEDILDVAGMPELDALRLLVDLLERGVIDTH